MSKLVNKKPHIPSSQGASSGDPENRWLRLVELVERRNQHWADSGKHQLPGDPFVA